MKHRLMMALGWACFQIWTRLPSNTIQCTTPFGLWLLSWAGYYAFDESQERPS